MDMPLWWSPLFVVIAHAPSESLILGSMVGIGSKEPSRTKSASVLEIIVQRGVLD